MSNNESLDGAWAKVNRARAHFEALERDVREFLESRPNLVLHERDANGREHKFRVRVLREPPSVEWAVLIGDCAHNLRSALDHIAWGLSEKEHPVTTEDTATQFPIFFTKAGFDDRGLKQIWRIKDQEVIALIRDSQPYNIENEGARRRHALWGVRTLDNVDKHKLLLATVTVHQESTFLFEPQLVAEPTITISEEPLKDNAIVATIVCDPPSLDASVKAQFTFTVVFRDNFGSDAPLRVHQSLALLIDYVGDRVAKFARFL
jgi:hypothetical protein